MTCSRFAVTLAIAGLCAVGLAAPARGQVTTSNTDDQELRPPRVDFGSVFAQMSLSGVFDTNIDHDDDDLDSYGGVASARLGWRRGPASVEYRLGFNRFANSTRWNRTTHRVVTRFTERLAPDWTLSAYGDIALQHTSEDRQVGNYYTVQPRIEYRVDGKRRVRARVRYRFKRVEEDPGSNSTRSEAGLEFEQRFGSGQRASAELRYQRNHAVHPRQRYEGPVWDIEYRSDIGDLDELRAGVELRHLTYPERLVSSGLDALLHTDDRWAYTFSWTRAVTAQIEWRIDYELERRLSNDPSRVFTAHRVGWTLTWEAGR